MYNIRGKMPIGADYYPEHWPRERWETDARLMQSAGFNITRLAEFSWSKLEPVEGQFDLDWLEDAVNLLGKFGISSILCTPTPTMPKWVYDKYPDTVAVNQDGHPIPFGNRQNNCFTSHTYRFFSRRITKALAERFRDNPNVVGWQLDNELSGPFCYCRQCEGHFQDWLAEKYRDIDVLNREWGTNFWSHTYSNFKDLHLPRHRHPSPSLYLDYRRFHSDNVVKFAGEQAEIIRELCPGHFITHNYMGLHSSLDYFKLGELLDFISEDYYYNYGVSRWDDRFGNYLTGAQRLGFIRGVKGKPFWIMENSAGALGWETYGRNLRPGEMRRMTFQNMAHGSVGQIWFRWRTSRFGTEQYWHGVLEHSGVPGRRYHDAAAMTPEMQKVYAEVAGGAVRSDVAIVTDFNDRWGFDQQPNSDDFSYTKALYPYYKALYRRGVNMDFIHGCDDFGKYKLVLLPYKYILTEEYAARLEDFVQNGGVLLTTCRSGVKNECNVPHEAVLPGYLRRAAGIKIEEYESIDCYAIEYKGRMYTGGTLVDWIKPETAEVLGQYTEDGVPYAAVTANTFGKGQLWYVGNVPDESLADSVIADLLETAGVRWFDLPERTEMVIQEKDGVSFVFLLNHSDAEQTFKLAGLKGMDLLSGQSGADWFTVKANDVAVIKSEGAFAGM